MCRLEKAFLEMLDVRAYEHLLCSLQQFKINYELCVCEVGSIKTKENLVEDEEEWG